MNKTDWTVRIIATPPGEAPLWVREKWVALDLPVARYSSPKMFFGYGVLSLPRNWMAQWWGVFLGQAERISGFAVESVRAIDILATASPEAAAWWRANTPHLIAPRRYLVFHAEACRIADV